MSERVRERCMYTCAHACAATICMYIHVCCIVVGGMVCVTITSSRAISHVMYAVDKRGINMCIRICIHVCTYVHMCIGITYIYVYVDVYMYIYIYIYTPYGITHAQDTRRVRIRFRVWGWVLMQFMLVCICEHTSMYINQWPRNGQTKTGNTKS